ncbi:MAG: hypothetical protein F2545_04885 [Actinobacteria bacterium]|uniref:Unannotated protein n=1 Tax=freshwater metagenome TaxID=449393 RepID=A0A6J6DDD1_9ZZZZ|nr:hypothetical protein [Actinomycetota bacterium]
MAAFDIVTFSLRPEISDDTFIQIDAQMQEWTYVHLPGIMRRTVARDAHGQWIVIQLFDTLVQCGTEYFTRTEHPVTEWSACIDHSTVVARAYTLL